MPFILLFHFRKAAQYIIFTLLLCICLLFSQVVIAKGQRKQGSDLKTLFEKDEFMHLYLFLAQALDRKYILVLDTVKLLTQKKEISNVIVCILTC